MTPEDADLDEFGLPAPPRCPECDAELVPDPFEADGRLQIGYSCPTHGVVSILGSPFED